MTYERLVWRNIDSGMLLLGKWLDQFSSILCLVQPRGLYIITVTWCCCKPFNQWQCSFQMKAALPLAKRLSAVSDCSSNTQSSLLLCIWLYVCITMPYKSTSVQDIKQKLETHNRFHHPSWSHIIDPIIIMHLNSVNKTQTDKIIQI